ncbi:MAG: Flp pilus assembly protein CpaB [Pirellula sp.]|jgi:pilus assembly protein CpaB|nr:Flp pilus assembly protein CpaB [Pirellula sp.]
MRTKSLILLIIAIGCGVVASVAVSQVMMEKQDGEAPRTSGILVTAKDISPMTKLTAELIRVEQWPVDRIPLGSLTDTKEIEGKYAKQRLYTGEPIIEAKLSARGKDLVVPTGFRIFDLKVDDSNGGSGYIGPGDRVDVTGFFEKGNRFPVSKSVRVMRNIEVAMVDGISFRDPEAAPKRANTIQLLVQDKQYEVLDTASNLGKLKLSLRAPDAEGTTSGNEPLDSGESFLKWLKDSEVRKEQTVAATTAVSSLSLLKGMFDSMKPQQKIEARKEMMILTPGSVSIYRWVHGRKMPVLLNPEDYYNAPDQAQVYSLDSGAAYADPSLVPATAAPQTTSANPLPSESGTPAAPPADPSNASQSNMVWDPKTGTWQSGGFTPVYPQSK